MQLFHPSPLTRRDAFESIGIGSLFLVVATVWTIRKLRAHTFENVHLIKTILFLAVSIFLLIVGAQRIIHGGP